MSNYELSKLTRKFLNGTASDEEKQALHQWYDSAAMDEFAEHVNTNMPESEQDVKKRIFLSLQNKIKAGTIQGSAGQQPTFSVKKLIVTITSIAAMLVGFIVWHNQSKVVIADKLVLSPKSKITMLAFADGSRAWLNAGSVLKYPKKFTGKVRMVELVEGHAFFVIKHMSGHPFVVKTKNLNVTVLGTSFDVRAYKKEGTTKVSVVSGKVGITLPGHPAAAAIMLIARQQIVLNPATNQVVKEQAREAVVNLWCKDALVFDQENLSYVFKAIEKKYNTKITVADKELLSERISITLGNQRLDTIMEILSFTKHFNYKMANDSTVVIK